MKMKQILMSVLALTTIASLTACGTQKQTKIDDALNKIKEKGTLIVALNPDFAPFEFQTIKNGKNKIVGSDIDLANEIGKSLGVKVKFEAMNFNNVLASVQSGKADMAISGISATAERKKAYDFSLPYYTAKNVMIVKKTTFSQYQKFTDFEGEKVAAQKGSIQENILTDQIKGVKAVSLTKSGQMINELKNGTVSGVIFEEPIAKAYVGANPELAIVSNLTFDSKKSDSYAIALPKHSGKLKEKVDQVIKKLTASGKINQLVEKNFNLSQDSSK